MSCNYTKRRRLRQKCPSLPQTSLYLTVFVLLLCHYHGFWKLQKSPEENLWGKKEDRNHCFTSLVWPHCFVESLTHRAACMQQPQWTPLTTASSTVHFCFCSLSFPTSPPPSLHIQHHSTGSLMADSTQEILHRSLAWEYKTSPPLCARV